VIMPVLIGAVSMTPLSNGLGVDPVVLPVRTDFENARAANGSLHVRWRRPVPWITVGTTNLGGLATVHLADP
jgi:hypothetical protein